MSALDYLKLFDPGHMEAAGIPASDNCSRYEDTQGIEYRHQGPAGESRQEAVRLGDDLLLIAGDTASPSAMSQQQVVSEGDWIHMQFRLAGAGSEVVGNAPTIRTDAHSCVIVRYPQGAVITRETEATDHFRVACLYLRPRLLRTLLNRSFAPSPDSHNWLSDDSYEGVRSAIFPISAPESAVINGVFDCSFSRDIRRNYMYAKSLELLSHAAHRITGEQRPLGGLDMRASDKRRVIACHELISGHLSEPLTLADLARRVGLSRSKLAVGFKSVYGIPLKEYWRELRLCHARDLLIRREGSVTSVAYDVGYAETGCLTRAYQKRFGHSPKDAHRFQ